MNLDLFDFDDLEELAVKATCRFRGCSNEASKEVKYTNGKQSGSVKVCETCKEKSIQTPTDITYYVCGQLMFIEEIWFREK